MATLHIQSSWVGMEDWVDFDPEYQDPEEVFQEWLQDNFYYEIEEDEEEE